MKTIPAATKKERNWNLIREILINTTEGTLDPFFEEQAKISDTALVYNLKILKAGGFLTNFIYKESLGGGIIIDKLESAELTWEGNDLLNSIRDDSIWSKVINKIKLIGGDCSVEILKEVAVNVAKAQLGLM